MVVYKVILLDGESLQFYDKGSGYTGAQLLDNVIQKMQLNDAQKYGDDKDYFSLSYTDSTRNKMWLDNSKLVEKQLKNCAPVLYMEFRFYPPSYEGLVSGYSVNMLVLQVRRDILNRVTPCSFSTLAILGAYAVQSEVGDWQPEFNSIKYLVDMDFSPFPSRELLTRIMSLHRTVEGMTGSDADVGFLEVATKLAEYGIRKYAVRDWTGKPVQLGISSSGLYVYDGYIRTSILKWSRIVSISEKRGSFHVKWKESKVKTDPLVEEVFKCVDQKEAKHILVVAKEEHRFFRLKVPALFEDDGNKWKMSTRRGDGLHKERRQRERGTSMKPTIFDEPDQDYTLGMAPSISSLSIRRGYNDSTMDHRERRISPSPSVINNEFILQPHLSLPTRQASKQPPYDHRRYNSYGYTAPNYSANTGVNRRDSLASSEFTSATATNDRMHEYRIRQLNDPFGSPPHVNGGHQYGNGNANHGSLLRNGWGSTTEASAGKYYGGGQRGTSTSPLTNGHSYTSPPGRVMQYYQKHGGPGVHEEDIMKEVNNNLAQHPAVRKQYSGGSGGSGGPNGTDYGHISAFSTPPRGGYSGQSHRAGSTSSGGVGDVALPRFYSDSAGVSLDGHLMGDRLPAIEKVCSSTRYAPMAKTFEAVKEPEIEVSAAPQSYSAAHQYADGYSDPTDDKEFLAALMRVVDVDFTQEVDQIEIKKSV